jgi:hypothetical protein
MKVAATAIETSILTFLLTFMTFMKFFISNFTTSGEYVKINILRMNAISAFPTQAQREKANQAACCSDIYPFNGRNISVACCFLHLFV